MNENPTENPTEKKVYAPDYLQKCITKIDDAIRIKQYRRAMLLYVFLLKSLTEEDRSYVIDYYYDNISRLEFRAEYFAKN